MRILVVNDDGIEAEGIKRLAKGALSCGEVWVVAPKHQCSAMSSRVTVRGEIAVELRPFPVEGVKAYSVDGTPVDCVKVALKQLMPQKPDIVFSGINEGYNAGFDIQYSGTIGAAMEGLLNGIPAIAFSREANEYYDVVDEYLVPVIQELLKEPLLTKEIWNVNFPGCTLGEFRGIQRDCVPAKMQFFQEQYKEIAKDKERFVLSIAGKPNLETMPEGTDVRALNDRYIAIGKIKNLLL